MVWFWSLTIRWLDSSPSCRDWKILFWFYSFNLFNTWRVLKIPGNRNFQQVSIVQILGIQIFSIINHWTIIISKKRKNQLILITPNPPITYPDKILEEESKRKAPLKEKGTLRDRSSCSTRTMSASAPTCTKQQNPALAPHSAYTISILSSDDHALIPAVLHTVQQLIRKK